MDEHDHHHEPQRQSSAVDNPYLALHATVPMEDFFAESERRIREQLEALRPVAEKEPIPGIQFWPSLIAVDTERWPQYCDALSAFDLFCVIRNDHKEEYVHKQLLARGFRIEDLPHLKILRWDYSEGVSKQTESTFQKKIGSHPLRYLDNPTLAQLETTSVEDMRDYIEFQSKARLEAERERATSFMLKLNPHSQRVMLAFMFEELGVTSSGRNYRTAYTNEYATKLRQQMIDYRHKQGQSQ